MSENVFICQKRALRSLAGITDSAVSCRSLFRDLGVLTLVGLLILELAARVFQKKNELLTGADIHCYSTRQSNLLRVPYHRLTMGQRSPDSMGIRFFNVLPDYIKSKPNISAFRRCLKIFLVENVFYNLEEFFSLCGRC